MDKKKTYYPSHYVKKKKKLLAGTHFIVHIFSHIKASNCSLVAVRVHKIKCDIK